MVSDTRIANARTIALVESLELSLLNVIDSLDPDTDVERTLEVDSFVKTLKDRMKFIGEEMDRKKLEMVERHKGDLQVGDMRYYVGATKKHVNLNKEDTYYRVMDLFGGDIMQVLDVMTSQPWKYGAIKTMLGEDVANELFETTTVKDVKTGKPKRTVKVVDTNFVKIKPSNWPTDTARVVGVIE